MTYKPIDHLVSMRDNLTITTLLFTLAFFVTVSVFQTYAYAQSHFVDPDKEVIVRFRPGNITPPLGRTTGTPAEFNIPSAQLRATLSRWRANKLSQLIENFQPEDRFRTDRFGQVQELTDWTDVYVIELPDNAARDSLIGALSPMPEVRYAEPNAMGKLLGDEDEHFPNQWALKNTGQGGGTSGVDIDATEAWDIATGSSWIKIAVIETGMQTDHPDFTGRVTGDAGNNFWHGTAVTGIVAAKGFNTIGIAGVAWNVGIINEDMGIATKDNAVLAVYSAIIRGAHITNNSYGLIVTSDALEDIYNDAYRMNITSVAAMGNSNSDEHLYPAFFGRFVIAVGATTHNDDKAVYSNFGSWIDVTAPGGSGKDFPKEESIFSTLPGSSYGYEFDDGIKLYKLSGTSFAAPIVSGIAALLLSHNPNLYNDDVTEIIKRSAEKVSGMNGNDFTNEYGHGRVNARFALDYIRSPNSVKQLTAVGGTSTVETGWYRTSIDGQIFDLRRYKVRKSVSFSDTYVSVPGVWGRGVATIGYSVSPWYAMPWSDSVPGTVTKNGATLETYIYETIDLGGIHKWIPASAANVKYAYTVVGEINDPPVVTSGPNMNTSGISPNDTRTVTISAYDPEGQSLSYAWSVETRFGGIGWITGTGTSVTYHAPCPGLNKVAISSSPPGPLQPDPNSYSENRVKAVVSDGVTSTTVYTPWFFINGSCGGGGGPPGGIPKSASIPDEYSLSQNHPNPFNPETIIRFGLPTGGNTTVTIFDISGREVTRLVDGFMPAGFHRVTWNAVNSASGLYFYRIRSGGFVKTMKMTVMK